MARRLTKELAEFEKNSPEWCTVGAVDDDLMHWNAMLAGPENTPYAGGVFSIDLQFPNEYPFKAPRVKFLTRVYHPNVKSQTGEICADIINENWGPTLNVLHCLTAIKQILEQPDIDNPLEPEIAKQLQSDRKEFDNTASEWTKQYASMQRLGLAMVVKRALAVCLFLLDLAAYVDANSLNTQKQTPVVLWYAPFLSGGGYCSEAHSYVTSISAALHSIEDAVIHQVLGDDQEDDDEGSSASASDHTGSASQTHDQQEPNEDLADVIPFSLFVTQHGDSFNAAFIRDIPSDMRELLEEHWIEPRDFHWRLRDRKIAIAVCHSEPGAWHPAHYSTSRCPPEGARYTVGRTMFETDRVPSGWSDRMNTMDEIWVPTRFQEKVFVDGGVRLEAIQVVPEAVDVAFFDPQRVTAKYDLASEMAGSGVSEATKVFLSIFKWEERKAWRVLLKGYFEAFAKDDDVVLVLLTNAYHGESENAKDFIKLIESFTLETMGRPLSELPRLHVLPPQIPQEVLPTVYKAATAFVLPSRGEGWGRPHVEAMAMELPVIATFWSGTTEYMTEENSYPLRIDGLIEITEGAFRGHKWAAPSVDHLKELLVRVTEHPEEAIAKGKRARLDMVTKYSPDVIGKVILNHIERIIKHVKKQHEEATSQDDHDEL